MIKRWNVGTPRLKSPGIVSRTTYKNADLWALVLSVYFLVEGKDLFEIDKAVRDNFEVDTRYSSVVFREFVYFVLNAVIKDRITRDEILDHEWLRELRKDPVCICLP